MSTQHPERRRNGLRPACEPCRKAKVRCDNTSTASICSRCRKRQAPELCIFLDAPMTGATKPKPKPKAKVVAASTPFVTTITAITPVTGTPSQVNGYSGGTAGKGGSYSGFFGSTSFGATIHQASANIHRDGVPSDSYADELPATLHCVKGAKVLKQIPSFSICERLLEQYEINSAEIGFPKVIIKSMFQTLRAKYGNFMDGSQEDLVGIARELCASTSEPLSSFDAAEEWKVGFEGVTRWESVGIVFCALAYGVASLVEKDGLFAEVGMKKPAYMDAIKECIELCVELCRGSLNTLVCNLLYKNLLLETILRGDSSMSVWRLHHDLVAMTTALGLHCYQGTPNVTIHSEMTKKLTANCFWGDKEIAMFTGRPPALSRTYHTCPLPLDVSDEALMAGGENLQAEIDSLDEHGWNTKNMMHNATISRMMTLAAIIQDEILELFIGNPTEFSMDRVNALKKKAEDIFVHVPNVSNITKDFLMEMDDDFLMWRFLFGRLDYLRIHFLLERLSHERGHESKQRLLEVAREMVDLIVFLWLQRDRSVGRHYDLDYVIMCYGMPSTGILCTTLLKQAQNPHNIPPTEKLPTAEVVQSFSLMIGFLEWIKPSAGNYKLCRRMSTVVRRVLDTVFDPPPPPTQESETNTNVLWQGEDMWNGMLDDVNDWDWLNSIDWSRGPYAEFPLPQ